MRNPRNDTLERSDRSPCAPTKPVGADLCPARAAPRRATSSSGSRLSPDGEVAPDVRAKAPGRGAWIGVGRAALEAAIAKGKLKGALARAFKTSDVDRPRRSRRRASRPRFARPRSTGSGSKRAPARCSTGSERIEAAARAGKVHLLIHAADAGEDGNRKLDQAWRVGGRRRQRGLVFPEDRTILSMALGRENVVHVALDRPCRRAAGPTAPSTGGLLSLIPMLG